MRARGTFHNMASYVDAAREYPDAGLRFTTFCHLLADSRVELRAFADRLGVPAWTFQDHPWRWHHDLPGHLRPLAVELGAREVTMHEVGALLRHRKEGYLAGIALDRFA